MNAPSQTNMSCMEAYSWLQSKESTPKSREEPSQPNDKSIRSWDVLCGKSKVAVNHAGNKRFRELITHKTEAYMRTREKRKSFLALEIVKQILGQGGRFLKRNSLKGTWEELDEAQSVSKVMHGLRDVVLAKKKKHRTADNTFDRDGCVQLVAMKREEKVPNADTELSPNVDSVGAEVSLSVITPPPSTFSPPTHMQCPMDMRTFNLSSHHFPASTQTSPLAPIAPATKRYMLDQFPSTHQIARRFSVGMSVACSFESNQAQTSHFEGLSSAKAAHPTLEAYERAGSPSHELLLAVTQGNTVSSEAEDSFLQHIDTVLGPVALYDQDETICA